MNIAGFEIVYEQGVGDENEDAYVALPDQGLFAVIDGATALGEGALSGRIAAQTVRAVLEEHGPRVGPLLEVAIRANGELGRRVAAAGSEGAAALPPERRSSCGVAAIRVRSEGPPGAYRAEYVHAGDCMIFLEIEGEGVRALTHDRISRFDGAALAEAQEEAERLLEGRPERLSGDAITEHLRTLRSHVAPTLQANRRRMNTPDGYGSVDGSPEAPAYFEAGLVPLNHVRRVLLLSDGLEIPGASPGQEGWLETARFAFRHGLEALYRRVLELEDSDPACYRFPRFKSADDKTGLLITLGDP